jgi:hypothetical protein
MITPFRELTRAELREIRKLAAKECANYDRDYGCLPLDGKCYMSYGVAYTSSKPCIYFRKAVLPLNPTLSALFSGEAVVDHIRRCSVCGKKLYVECGKQKYCPICALRVHRRQKTESERKRRLSVDV